MHYVLSKRFEKDFSKLPKKIKTKTLDKLQIFINNPMDSTLNNHPLVGKWGGCRSINITGDIRAVYVPAEHHIVQFVAIGSHSDLYS